MHTTPPITLQHTTTCNYYQTKLFHKMTFILCCGNDRVVVPNVLVPPTLLSLITSQNSEARNFRHNICSYNHVFAFTLMGVLLDESLQVLNQRINTFRAHEALYHKINSILPVPGSRPRFLQMFVYDTEHEINNRLYERTGLCHDIIVQIINILNEVNPFIHNFKQLA